MNTCTGIFRRHAWRLGAALITATLVASSAMPIAVADQVGDKKAQAQKLADQINALGLKEAALGEKYDAAVLAAQATAAKIRQQQAAVDAANANAAQAKAAIQADAINAYVNGGTLSNVSNQSSMSQADGGLLANEYLNTLASTQADNLDAFRNASTNAHILSNQLQALMKQQSQAAAATQAARRSAQATQAQLQSTLSQVKGQLATLVAQIQAEQQAAAARAAAARVNSVNATFTGAPVPVGAGAGEAVAAALSRVGLPYVWGAAGPSTFDCSGLILWAWAKAGVSLPHFSGAQYANTTHIPMSQLQPGDLVFFSDPGQHVAMYIGGGQVVEAPHTGADVHVIPLYSSFVLASRP